MHTAQTNRDEPERISVLDGTGPAIADLVWSHYWAMATQDFWSLYNADRNALKGVGITVRPGGSGWEVHFDPSRASDEQIAAALDEARAALDRKRAADAEARRRDAETAEERRGRQEAARAELRERQREYEEQIEAQFRSRQAEAVERARACLERYGEFADHKKTLRDAVADPDVYLSKASAIQAVLQSVDRTEFKFRQRLGDARRNAIGGVDWTDEEVVSSVEYLTRVDDDHASQRNDRGWSQAHSSTGHWCRAAMSEHRVEAIKMARIILGGYRRQLVEARVLKARLAAEASAAEYAGQTIARTCICCEHYFPSRGVQNRVCEPCRAAAPEF